MRVSLLNGPLMSSKIAENFGSEVFTKDGAIKYSVTDQTDPKCPQKFKLPNGISILVMRL